jgi:lysophospholipase L1-like esterase
MKRTSFLATAIAPLALSASLLAAGEDQLPPNSRLAIIGDSITEQKQYCKFMETYLVACAGRTDIHVFQFGWSGETAPGFLARMENDLAVFKPTAATTCYGMNDGSYQPYKDDIGKRYEDAMTAIGKKFDAQGVKNVVFGSPGAVDTKYFVKPGSRFPAGQDAVLYNENLAQLGAIDKKLAAATGKVFADVHTPMIEAMAKAKAALGNDFDVCGGDGVHPNPDGQLIMAYAFLKGLGCKGDIADITVDMNGSATASEGHKVLSSGPGKVELESTRYPFVLEGDLKSSKSTRSITPFLPFNEDLNRFTLHVKNLGKDKAKVTWGPESKEFSKEQLEKGVNLAAEFTHTPFDAAFNTYMGAVAKKQAFETPYIKEYITKLRTSPFTNEMKEDAQLAAAFTNVKEGLAAHQAALEAASRKALVPVKYTITIE